MFAIGQDVRWTTIGQDVRWVAYMLLLDRMSGVLLSGRIKINCNIQDIKCVFIGQDIRSKLAIGRGVRWTAIKEDLHLLSLGSMADVLLRGKLSDELMLVVEQEVSWSDIGQYVRNSCWTGRQISNWCCLIDLYFYNEHHSIVKLVFTLDIR